ncbi:hypothetical protein GL50803_0014602 [Giardia duodenalis]|uniref:Uncharacterized protein n=1 Tax=Giardia intestinalis (strain ATCC 50803 / WB clone C6) TaxID=184922 RepID=A8B3U3_GIAIC|nr:hypothetical protein GL50803_0014602 [Giardia intestinalis]KAE8303236.1 hypothetical protein GL50803_0014602 [Giardia intestinalis]|eukprot:XP_001710312.1 Hypothetical protein GL50803_14602 [Giardia lamblia ATCC 50803]
MLPNLASEYLNRHRLLSRIEDALNTCIASNLDSPEAYIASALMQMSPGPCTITKVMLLPTNEVLYTVRFCEILRSFTYQLKPGNFNKLATLCLSSISVGALPSETVREFLPSLSLSTSTNSVTPSTGSRAQSSQKDRAKSEAKEDSKQDRNSSACVTTYAEPLFFDENLKTPLHDMNIFEKVNNIWPLLLKHIGGDRELGLELYEHLFDMSLQMLSSSRILELRRRATNVNSLTIRCPIPMFVVFSWGTILNLALVPVGSSLLSFQALIHELNSYATSTLMGDGAAGSGATKKKADVATLSDPGAIFPILLKQEPGLHVSTENPATVRLLELKDEYFEMRTFDSVRPTVREKTAGAQINRPSDRLRKYFGVVAIFRALVDILQKTNEDWRRSAKIQVTLDLPEIVADMKCVTANADDVLRELKERVDAVYPNCRSITPNYSSMVGFLNSFEARPLVSEFELFLFNILLSQKWGHLDMSFTDCKNVPEESVSIEYDPVAEAAKQEVAQAAPKKGTKQPPPQAQQSPPGAADDSGYKPPIVYQSYSKEAVARQILTSMSQSMALTEVSRQVGAVRPEEATVSLSLFFDSMPLVSALNTKLAKYFPVLSAQVKANTRQYTKTPAICALGQAEYLDAVCIHCHNLEPAKALHYPTKLMLPQGSRESTSSIAGQASIMSFRGGERQMGITPRAGSRFAGPGSQVSASDQRATACLSKDSVADAGRGLTRTTLLDDSASISKSLSLVDEVSICEEPTSFKGIVLSYQDNESTVLTTEIESMPGTQANEDVSQRETPKEKGKEKEAPKAKDVGAVSENSYINRVTCALIYGYEGLHISNVKEIDEFVNVCMYLKSDGRLV